MAQGSESKGVALAVAAGVLATLSACSPAITERSNIADTGDRASSSDKTATPTGEASAEPSEFVSFAPSNTELLYAIGAQDNLKGVCAYCDYPVVVKQKEKVGTFVSANFERLANLHAQSALLVSGQDALASQLKNHNVHVDVLKNGKVSDIARNVRRLGELTNQKETAGELASNLETQLKELHEIIKKAKTTPRVFYCVWPQPLMTAGKRSFLNDVVTECGGINIAGELDVEYPQFSAERLVNSNPDVIVLPYETNKQKDFLKRAPFNALRAVREERVFVLPDTQHDHLSRPTLRIVLGISWLAKQIHPDLKDELSKWEEQSKSSLKLKGDD